MSEEIRPPTQAEQIAYLQDQLRLVTQELIRHQLTLNHLTHGQTLMQKAKPGFENTIIEVPVPGDAPTYLLVRKAEETPMPSPILMNDGSAFQRKNGVH